MTVVIVIPPRDCMYMNYFFVQRFEFVSMLLTFKKFRTCLHGIQVAQLKCKAMDLLTVLEQTLILLALLFHFKIHQILWLDRVSFGFQSLGPNVYLS